MNMTRLIEFLTRPIPRPLLIFGTPVLALFLILFFVVLRFPYDKVLDLALVELEASTGTVIRYGSLSPRFSLAGPGIHAENLDITTADGETIHIDPLDLRAAWSFGWLSGSPLVYAVLTSDLGHLDGYATFGDSIAWDGFAQDIQLETVPVPENLGLDLEGLMDVEADVVMIDGKPEGDIEFEARDGVFSHQAVPIPIEFDTLVGSIVLGGKHIAKVDEFQMQGPLVLVDISGTVDPGRGSGAEVLDLDIDLTIKERNMLSMLQGLGLDLAADGTAQFKLGGTVATPQLR